MRTKQILKELSAYLTREQIIRIDLNLALKGSAVMILCLADIMNQYNSNDKNEKIVAHLLSQLCRNHFK